MTRIVRFRSMLDQHLPKKKDLGFAGADPNHIHFTVCADVPLARTKSAEVAKVLIAHPKIDVNAWSSELKRSQICHNSPCLWRRGALC